jgi:hypothetical protein
MITILVSDGAKILRIFAPLAPHIAVSLRLTVTGVIVLRELSSRNLFETPTVSHRLTAMCCARGAN